MSAGGAPIDVQLALKRVLRSAKYVDGIARGLREAVKALDKRTAHFAVFATACDEPAYEKLVRALCKNHGIPIFEVESKSDLGEWIGQCKIDQEGNARKVVGCSCAVVKNYGRDEEARKALEEYFNSQKN